MSTFKSLVSALKQAGLHLTPQRLAICMLLSETRDHPTAASIYSQVHAEYPSLSLMTVYNTLHALVDLGAVNELGGAGDDIVHYDGNLTPHINLACTSCHKIVDVASPKVIDLEGEVRSTSGFRIRGARIVYYGLCPDCQQSTIS
jgi:Fur family transcriptional regulator, peroxide stress response regulator